ncbi:MAG: hypothetical protein V1766_09495 [Pseudomonadota bacterium]
MEKTKTTKKEDQAMKKTEKKVTEKQAENVDLVKKELDKAERVEKATEEKKAPKVEKAKKDKPKSAINTMKELLKKKATDKEITKVFTSIYAAKGKDAEFTAKRISIYKKIAEKEV